MIELASHTTVIDTPVDRAFNYLVNMEYYGDWFPGVVAIRSANQLAHGRVGKQYAETLRLPDGEHQLLIEVDSCIANRLFMTRGQLPGIWPQMTVLFSDKGAEGCQIELYYHSRSRELTGDSEPVLTLRRDLATRAGRGLAELKRLLESASPSQVPKISG